MVWGLYSLRSNIDDGASIFYGNSDGARRRTFPEPRIGKNSISQNWYNLVNSLSLRGLLLRIPSDE